MGHECPICMERFQLHDIVSWSPTSECEHVFHHACIKTWLLHHDCCPYCRVIVLTVDRDTSENSEPSMERWRSSAKRRPNVSPREELLQMARQRHERLHSTYYCLEEGLVTFDRPLSTTDQKTIKVGAHPFSRRNIVSNVSSEEMMALRVHPKSCHLDVVVTMHAGNATRDAPFADDSMDIEFTVSNEVSVGGLGEHEPNDVDHRV